MTFRAIESPSKEDDTQWCIYWVCFGVLQFFETFSDYILFWFWPYHFAEAALIVYLAHPAFRGADVVYNSLIGPYMRTNVVDKVADRVNDTINAVREDIKKEI